MPGPGSKRMKPNGFVEAASIDLPDVDPHAVGEHRHLVDERDVDRAEDVLEQLRELGGLGRADRHDPLAHAAVDRDGALGARLGQAADDLRRRADRVVGAAGIDALGREGERRSPSPARRPDSSSSGTRYSRVVPGNVVDSSTIVWPRRMTPPSARAALSSGPSSGSRLAVSGVGTQIEHRLGVVQVDEARAEAAALEHGAAAARR